MTSVIIVPIVFLAWIITNDTLPTWNNFWLLQMWQRVQKQALFTTTLSEPHWKSNEIISLLYLLKIFPGKLKIFGSISIMYIMPLKGSLVNRVVKALGESACWVFILQSHTLILTCLFLNGVVRYARNHILIQEPS